MAKVERLAAEVVELRADCRDSNQLAADNFARAKTAEAEIKRLRTELSNAHRLLSQSVGWQRDAEIAKAKLGQENERLRVGLQVSQSAVQALGAKLQAAEVALVQQAGIMHRVKP